MAELTILEYPDPILRSTSSPITDFNADLSRLVDDLFDTLSAKGGLGLSAPQAGQLVRVLVVDVPDDDYGPVAYINPTVLKSAAPGLVEEGCMSVPGILGNVIRPTQIRVRAQDVHGDWSERDLVGMHAVCVQHEIDHLDGRLFIDRLSWFRRLRIRAAARREAQHAAVSDVRHSAGV